MWIKQRVWVLSDSELKDCIPHHCLARIEELESPQARFYYVLAIIKLMESHMRIKRKQVRNLTRMSSSENNFWNFFRVPDQDLIMITEVIKIAEVDFLNGKSFRFKNLSPETFSIEDFLYLVI